MSITSDRIRENGFIHALADDAADEIEALEKENANLIEACKCFRHFVNMRGGRWAEMKEILDNALTSPATPTATASQEADEDAPFTLDDAIAHANGLEHQVKMLTRQRDGLELIARMVAGALEKAGFKADEVDNPADAIELLHTRLMAATASQESAPGQEAVAIGWAVPISGEYQFFRSYDQAARERREYCDSTGEEFVAPRQCYLAPPTSTAIAAMVIKQAAEALRELARVNVALTPREALAKARDVVLSVSPAAAEAELEALMMRVAELRDQESAKGYMDAAYQVSDAAIVRRVLDDKGE